MNLSIGVLALGLAWLFLPESRAWPSAITRVDGLGLGLMVLGVGALQVALDRGNRLDWFDSSMLHYDAITAGWC